MRSIDNPDLWIKVLDLINDGWRNLEIDIVQMHYIRMKILQNLPDFSLRIPGINNLKRIRQLTDFPRKASSTGAAITKGHVLGVALRTVSDNPSFMLHPEILHLMSHFLQLSANAEDVGLRSTVWI